MADDIVTRLRALSEEWWECCNNIHGPLIQAADEIERLRRRVDDLTRCLHDDRFEIERLRSALHLAAGLLSSCAPYDQMHPDRVLELLTGEKHHDHHQSTQSTQGTETTEADHA